MSTHINHIEINNFKSIQHQVIDGCKKINVFIGQPNVGKSAILEAMSLFAYHDPTFKGPIDSLCRVKNSNELFYNGTSYISAAVEINKQTRYFLDFDLFGDGSPVLTIGFNDQSDKSGLPLYRTLITDGKIKLNDSIRSKRKKLIEDSYSIRKYSFNASNYTKQNSLEILSFPFGDNLVEVIKNSSVVRKEVIDLFKNSGLILNIDQGDNSIRGYKQLEEGLVFTIPFYQMADTLQRLIFHKAAILSNKDAVLLFEEPEAHMFPPYVRQFTGDIISNIDNNQYFIATHSPVVLEDFLDGAIDDLSVYLVSLKNGQTVVKRLSEDELKEVNDNGVDLFFNIESYLD